MKTKCMIFLVIFLTAAPLFAVDEAVLIQNGFGTGQDYLKMTKSQQRAYAMGVVNGILLSPLFGAPKGEMKWFESYIVGMSDEQVAAILLKYLENNPGRWHDRLNILAYSAIKEAFDMSRSKD
jgi:hypothetical protein